MSASQPITPALAQAFRAIRAARGMTQEDFVEVSGRTYISELERGAKKPTLAKLDQLAGLLGVHPVTLVSYAYLLRGDCDDFQQLGRLIDEQLAALFRGTEGA